MDEITIINAAKGEATYEDPSEHYTWDPTPIAWDTSEYPKQPRRDCRSGFLGNNRDLLGAGAYGLVYRVEKQRGQDAGKKFAMKMIEDKNMTGPEDNILLDREVAVFKNMDHPHLCKIEDIFYARGKLYLILPLMDANTPNQDPDLISWLNNRVLRGDYLPERATATLIHHVAAAIKHLSDHGIIHRDLKPENILVGPAGLDGLQVTDFGLVRLGVDKHNGLSDGTFAKGTGGYIAPELLDGNNSRNLRDENTGQWKKVIDYGKEPHKVDVFSLGIIFYLAVAMSQLGASFRGIANGASLCDTDSRHSRNQWEFEHKVELIEGMLARDQAARYSIEEVLAHPYLTAYFECSTQVAQQARENREHSDQLIAARE